MRTGMRSPNETGVGTEAMLTEREAELLAKVKRGLVPCPWCGQPLWGEFVYFELGVDDAYAGVRLSCSCGFVEY